MDIKCSSVRVCFVLERVVCCGWFAWEACTKKKIENASGFELRSLFSSCSYFPSRLKMGTMEAAFWEIVAAFLWMKKYCAYANDVRNYKRRTGNTFEPATPVNNGFNLRFRNIPFAHLSHFAVFF